MKKYFFTPRHLRYGASVALLISLLFSTAHADEYSDAVQLTRMGSYTEAMAKVEKSLSKTPKDPKMRLLKALIQDRSGKTSEAILTLLRLVEDHPDLPEPYNNLAVFYASQNQYDKARGALEMAVKNDPAYGTAHENLGDVYAELARQSYKKALQNNGGDKNVDRKVDLIREIFAPGTAKPQKAGSPATAAPAATGSATANTQGSAPSSPSPQSAPLAVAGTGASAVSSSDKAAVAKTPAPASAEADADAKLVAEAVQSWAKAWSARDVPTYLAAYGKDFEPAGNLTREAWEAERTARISSKASIKVTISNLQVTLEGSKATARFRQGYRATGISTTDFKTLELIKAGDRWEIVKETVGS